LDSPENAGPISAEILSVVMRLLGQRGGLLGLGLAVVLTSSIFVLGFVALYSSNAIFARLYGGMTIAELSPVRSPMKPDLDGGSRRVPPGRHLPVLLEPPAQAVRAREAVAANARALMSRAL